MCIKSEYNWKVLEFAEALEYAAQLALNLDELDKDDQNMSSKVRYPDIMALEATIVFNSVLSNLAIHGRYIADEQKAEEVGKSLHQFILEHYGFDTHSARQLLEDNERDQQST